MLFCFQVLLFNLTCQLFRNYKKITKTRNGICSSAELPPAYFIIRLGTLCFMGY